MVERNPQADFSPMPQKMREHSPASAWCSATTCACASMPPKVWKIGFGVPVVPDDMKIRQSASSGTFTTTGTGPSVGVNHSSVTAMPILPPPSDIPSSVSASASSGNRASPAGEANGADTSPHRASARLTAMCRLGTAIDTPTRLPGARCIASSRFANDCTACSSIPKVTILPPATMAGFPGSSSAW